MARPPATDAYLQPAIDLMVRQGISLRQAASLAGIVLTEKDCENLERRKSFNRLLWETRNQYWAELSRDPNYSKDSAIGQLITLAQKLTEDGSYDKAAEVVFKAAKIQGWTGNETQVNVFGQLTAKEFSELREKIKAAATPATETKPN